MTEAADIVAEFCALMVERDAELLRPLLADDAIYHNAGLPATTGVDAIVANLGAQFEAFPDSYEYKMVNLAADGDIVLTERLDLIRTGETIQGVPVMGAFRVREGKITRWTDYWDTGLPAKMRQGVDVTALIPAVD